MLFAPKVLQYSRHVSLWLMFFHSTRFFALFSVQASVHSTLRRNVLHSFVFLCLCGRSRNGDAGNVARQSDSYSRNQHKARMVHDSTFKDSLFMNHGKTQQRLRKFWAWHNTHDGNENQVAGDATRNKFRHKACLPALQ